MRKQMQNPRMSSNIWELLLSALGKHFISLSAKSSPMSLLLFIL